MKPRERHKFWDKVDVQRPSECWNWTGTITVYGYGLAWVEKKLKPSHRVAYELTFGKICNGMVIRHSCDNRKCCNPNHLSEGTHADNVADKVSRGRQNRGETSWNHSLKESDVKEIRAMASAGEKQSFIAQLFGICAPSISKIVNKKAWKHVEEDIRR